MQNYKPVLKDAIWDLQNSAIPAKEKTILMETNAKFQIMNT